MKISTVAITEVHAMSIYFSVEDVKRLAKEFTEAAAKGDKVSLEVE
jgi:hypothetical protein